MQEGPPKKIRPQICTNKRELENCYEQFFADLRLSA